MKLTRVENYSIKFGAAEEKPKEEPKPAVDNDDEYEDESFWSRNKKTLGALAAVGVAGIAITVAVKRGRNKSVEPKVVSNPKLDAYSLQQQLRDDLSKASSDKEIAALIKKGLANDNEEFRRNILSDLILSDSPSRSYINAKSWESLFDATVNFKLKDKKNEILSGAGYLKSLIGKLALKDMLSVENVDKIIAKMSGASDEIKVVVAKELIAPHLKGSELVEASFPPEQLKKITGVLSGIKSEKINVDIGAGTKIEYEVPELMLGYHEKYFKAAKFDSDFVADYKEFLGNTKISEDIKLQLIDKLSSEKFKENAAWGHKFKIDAIRESLDFVANAKAASYTADKIDAIFGRGNVFVLGEDLLKRLYNISTELSGQERVDIIDKLLASAKRLADSDSGRIKNIYCRNSFSSLLQDRFATKRDIFDNMPDHSYENISKFIDEIQSEMSGIKRDFASWKPSWTLEKEYDSLLYSFKVVLDKKRASVFGFDFAKEEEIWTKVDDFGKKTFGSYWKNYYHTRFSGSSGWGDGSSGSSSGYGYSGKSGKSRGSSGRTGGFSMFSKTKEAKQTLIKYLREQEELKELADQVETQDMDKNLLKSVKRKLSLAYHPDKAGDDAELVAKNTEIFKEISNAIDILEKDLGLG